MSRALPKYNKRRVGFIGGAAAVALTVQNAILGPLEDKRVAAINRIATAIGRTAERPSGLDALAPCTLDTEGTAGQDDAGAGEGTATTPPAQETAAPPAEEGAGQAGTSRTPSSAPSRTSASPPSTASPPPSAAPPNAPPGWTPWPPARSPSDVTGAVAAPYKRRPGRPRSLPASGRRTIPRTDERPGPIIGGHGKDL